MHKYVLTFTKYYLAFFLYLWPYKCLCQSSWASMVLKNEKIHLNTLGSGITALWKTLYELRTLCIDAEIFGPHGLMGRFRAKIYQEHTKAFSSMMFTLNILWLIWQKMILSNQVMSSALTYFLMKKLFCIKPIYLFALTLMNRDGKGLFTF